MSQQRRTKSIERQKKEARQAGRIINVIFIALVVIGLGCVIAAALFSCGAPAPLSRAAARARIRETAGMETDKNND